MRDDNRPHGLRIPDLNVKNVGKRRRNQHLPRFAALFDITVGSIYCPLWGDYGFAKVEPLKIIDAETFEQSGFFV